MHGFIRIMTVQMLAYANISLAYCHFAEPLSLPPSLPPSLLRPSPSSPQVSRPTAEERLLAAVVAPKVITAVGLGPPRLGCFY